MSVSHFVNSQNISRGSPGGSDDKESAGHAGDPGLIPGLGRYPGVGNSNPLHYSCMENPMDRRAWQAEVPMGLQSQTPLSEFHFCDQ